MSAPGEMSPVGAACLVGGRAHVGPLLVEWRIPFEFPSAAGPLRFVSAEPDSRGDPAIRWVVERAERPGESDGRRASSEEYGAFFGSTKLRFSGEDARLWSPDSSFEVSRDVVGRVWAPDLVTPQIAFHALAARHGLVHLHAAAVVHEGRAVVFVGGSGSGKTSATLALHAAGAAVFTDDWAYLDSRGETLWPIPRPLHVTAETLAAHPGLPAAGNVLEGVPKSVVPITRPCPSGLAIDSVVYVSIDSRSLSRIEPIQPPEAFALLLGSSAFAMVPNATGRPTTLSALAALSARPGLKLVAGPDALAEPSRLVRLLGLG